MFPLEIFPGGGFDSSVITIVLVGLVCLWALAEAFGFVFVGLVVPGYLTSVFIIAPSSAAIVLIEGLITYALVRGLSDGMGRAGAWSPFFGRDRFFAFVITSVIVRLVGELWLWSAIWDLTLELTGRALPPPGPLNSVGLVLVPLAANMFWKVGLRRGLTQLLLPTAVVWAVTTQLVLPLTNLRLAEFQLHYEDAAVDFLSSPRAYIILIVAAVLSTRFNLRFGWNFGGILVPALLAVSWSEPFKALITYGEVIVLVGVTTLVMKAPVVRTWNLEGPRKVTLVFGIGYLLKYVGAWVLLEIDPGAQVIDFFGFGYLLSSLLTLKVLEDGFAQSYLPTFAVSLAGFVIGAGIASGIHSLGVGRVEPVAVRAQADAPEHVEEATNALLRRTALFYQSRPPGAPIRAEDLDQIEAIGRRIDRLFDGADTSQWRGLSGPVEQTDLQWLEVGEADGSRAFLLAESTDVFPAGRGWGAYLFRPSAKGPVVEVPTVGGDPTRLLAAMAIAYELDARALLIGSVSTAGNLREIGPLESAQTPFHRMHLALSGRRVVQLRMNASVDGAQAYVGHRLDPNLSVAALRRTLGEVSMQWDVFDDSDRQRATSESTFTTVVLGRKGQERAAELMAKRAGVATTRRAGGEEAERASSLLTFLEGWMLGTASSPARVAQGYGELDTAATPADIELIDRAVFAPLVRMSRQPHSRVRTRRTLAVVRAAAAAVGMELGRVEIVNSDECYWTLSEKRRPLRGLGVVMISCEARSPVVLEVPYPRREFSTWRVAALIAGELQVRGLVFGSKMRGSSGASLSPEAEALSPGQVALDPLDPTTSFTAAHRAFQREYIDVGAPWAVQLRGLADERPLAGDMLVSPDQPVAAARAPAEVAALYEWFEQRGVHMELDEGQREYAPLRGLNDATKSYSRRVAGGRHLRLWVGAAFRSALTPSPSPQRMVELMDRRGSSWQEASIVEWMRRPVRSDSDASAAPISAADFGAALDEAQDATERFAATVNPIYLSEAFEVLADYDLQPTLLVDSAREQAWLSVRGRVEREVAEPRSAKQSVRRVSLRLQAPEFARGQVEIGRDGPVSELELLVARRVVSQVEVAASAEEAR